MLYSLCCHVIEGPSTSQTPKHLRFSTHYHTLNTFLITFNLQSYLHFTGMIDALVPLLFEMLTEKLRDCHDYLGSLQENLPVELFASTLKKPPSYLLRAAGCFHVYTEQLECLTQFGDLKPEVFQSFKEVGNIFLLLRDISEVCEMNDLCQVTRFAPLVNIM